MHFNIILAWPKALVRSPEIYGCPLSAECTKAKQSLCICAASTQVETTWWLQFRQEWHVFFFPDPIKTENQNISITIENVYVYVKTECLSQDNASRGINAACLCGSCQCFGYQSLILSCLVESYLEPFSENGCIYCLPPQCTREKGRLLIYHWYKDTHSEFSHTFSQPVILPFLLWLNKQVSFPVVVLILNHRGQTSPSCQCQLNLWFTNVLACDTKWGLLLTSHHRVWPQCGHERDLSNSFIWKICMRLKM